MSQTDLILYLLRRNPGGITALEALHAGAGMRLAARISDLKEQGYVIDSERVEGTTYVRYTIREPAQRELGL
jgi:hypothetical protein